MKENKLVELYMDSPVKTIKLCKTVKGEQQMTDITNWLNSFQGKLREVFADRV